MANIKLIGANFLEVEAKRNPDFSGKLSLKTDIQVNKFEKMEKSEDTLKITYIFNVDYGDLGKIRLKGNLFVLADEKIVEKITNEKENKEFNTPEHAEITNFIIRKASIKAFELEEELNLPIHIKLPTVSIKNKEE